MGTKQNEWKQKIKQRTCGGGVLLLLVGWGEGVARVLSCYNDGKYHTILTRATILLCLFCCCCLFYFLIKIVSTHVPLMCSFQSLQFQMSDPFFLQAHLCLLETMTCSLTTQPHVCSWPLPLVYCAKLCAFKAALWFPVSAVVAWSSVMYIVWNAHALRLLYHMLEADKASGILCETHILSKFALWLPNSQQLFHKVQFGVLGSNDTVFDYSV